MEVVNALRLRLFRREARQRMVEATLARLQEDLHDGTLHRPAVDWAGTLSKAIELANQHTARLGCRSLDVLHVAAAVLSGSRRFVTADRRQSQVARRAGLQTTRVS
jgi:hypothetical protein